MALLFYSTLLLADPDIPAEVRRRALRATVRLADTAQGVAASGVMVGRNGPLAYALTAAHVVRDPADLTLETFDDGNPPRPALAVKGITLLARDETNDLALLRFAAVAGLPAPLPIRPRGQAAPEPPFAALAVGAEPGPAAEGVQVLARREVRKRPGAAAVVVWEVARPQAVGHSGGPLVDARGFVVGLASGTAGGRGYYAHLDAVHALLKEQGLGWLAEPAKGE